MNTTTNFHLNPYAVKLCSLGRWISRRDWAPAGAAQLSVRTGDNHGLITAADKDKSELSPQDLRTLHWSQHGIMSGTDIAPSALIHATIYQLFSATKSVVQIQSVACHVFASVIQSDHYVFRDYELQQVCRPEVEFQQPCVLPLFKLDSSMPDLAAELLRRQSELSSGFIVRGHGFYGFGASIDQVRQQLEAWDFLMQCELERMKIHQCT